MFSLDRTGEFIQEKSSSRFNVPYFVPASIDFDRTYPSGSRERLPPPLTTTSHTHTLWMMIVVDAPLALAGLFCHVRPAVLLLKGFQGRKAYSALSLCTCRVLHTLDLGI